MLTKLFGFTKTDLCPAGATSKKLYSIEFMRIFFIFFVILGHCMSRYPGVKTMILNFFNTKYMQTWFGVEFFFIIGGFFLYKRAISAPNVWDLIKKTYTRLAPALIFIFILCVVFSLAHTSGLPFILTLLPGLGIAPEITGWGDWYVGVYFWCSLLYIALFHYYRNSAFLWTAIICYFLLCIKVFAPYSGWNSSYYTIIGSEIIRGIYSMGLGMAVGFITDKISGPCKISTKIFFTLVEIACLVPIFNFIVRSSHCHINFLGIEIVFGILLICIAHSAGYLSTLANKAQKVQLVSRYCYSIFLAHIFGIQMLMKHNGFGMNDVQCTIIVFVCAILIGIFEYHVVEQKIVPLIKNYMKPQNITQQQ